MSEKLEENVGNRRAMVSTPIPIPTTTKIEAIVPTSRKVHRPMTSGNS